MQKTFVLLLSVLLLLGCAKDMSTDTPQSNLAPSIKGNLSLSFDKASIPQGVTTIVMTLSRKGYLSLTKTLKVSTDSTAEATAEATFDSVQIGVWHLKVDAMSSSAQVLFTGQCDVTVYENIVTEVNLVLQPVSSGIGGIKIVVTWGSRSKDWVDNSTNPILIKRGTQYDGRGVGYPIILKDGSEYKMWYTNVRSQPDSAGGLTSIGLAVSTDGNTWSRYTKTPVLFPTPGAWDGIVVSAATVLKDSGEYKMYYSGYGNGEVRWQIGLATSPDGIHWQKYPEPILTGTTGWEYSIAVWGVVKVNETYYMYYHTGSALNIGVATSTDGIHWTRFQGNPILTPTEPWENSGLAMASVIYDNGLFKMVYENHDYSASFGYATSVDGYTWTKDAHNPMFSHKNTLNSWSPGAIAYGSLAKVGEQERMYYTGMTENSAELMIGFAYKK